MNATDPFACTQPTLPCPCRQRLPFRFGLSCRRMGSRPEPVACDAEPVDGKCRGCNWWGGLGGCEAGKKNATYQVNALPGKGAAS